MTTMVTAIPEMYGDDVFSTMRDYIADGLSPKYAYRAASHLHRKFVRDMKPDGYMGRIIATVNRICDNRVEGKLDRVMHFSELPETDEARTNVEEGEKLETTETTETTEPAAIVAVEQETTNV